LSNFKITREKYQKNFLQTMQSKVKIFASVLLLIFATYMVPEHYLKYFHPHEHIECSHSCNLEHASLVPKHHDCNQEKTYFFPPLPGLLYVGVVRPFLASIFQVSNPLITKGQFFQIPPRSPPAD
jgi:hypothetical protein